MPDSSRAALLTLAVATQFSPVASANERLRHNTHRWDFYAIPAKMDFYAIPCEAACCAVPSLYGAGATQKLGQKDHPPFLNCLVG